MGSKKKANYKFFLFLSFFLFFFGIDPDAPSVEACNITLLTILTSGLCHKKVSKSIRGNGNGIIFYSYNITFFFSICKEANAIVSSMMLFTFIYFVID